MKSDICFFLKIRNLIECIFGIQKLKIVNGKIVKTNCLYRIYVTALTSFFCYDVLCYNIDILMSKSFGYYTYIIKMSAFAHIFLSVALSVFAIQNVFISPSRSHKIFISFLEIEKQLDPLGKSFKISSLLLILFYILIKLLFLFYNMRMWNFKNKSILHFHLMTMSIELETIFYAMEINIINRYFEKINMVFIEMSQNKNFLLGEGMLLKIWSTTNKTTIKSKPDIKKIILIIERLTETMNNINSASGMKVRLDYLEVNIFDNFHCSLFRADYVHSSNIVFRFFVVMYNVFHYNEF